MNQPIHTAGMFSGVLHEEGICLQREGQAVVNSGPAWLSLATRDAESPVAFQAHAGELTAETRGLALNVSAEMEPGTAAPLMRVNLTVRNTANSPVEFNLKWALALADQGPHPRWLIPSLVYKDNPQSYESMPSLAGEENLERMRSKWWLFRADLMAVPMAMAWAGEHSAALIMPERQGGHMTAVGVDARDGRHALLGAWPYREEPRCRDCDQRRPHLSKPFIEFAELKPGDSVVVSFWLRADDGDPFAFGPILRETFSRWDEQHEGNPWFPTCEGAEHAAHGLFEYHYDPEVGALWETCAFEDYYGKNERHVDRFHMHSAFVSGIPYALPLRWFGQRTGRQDMAEAGAKVIDMCCDGLAPFGPFWPCYMKDLGWGPGWCAPHRLTPEMWASARSQELQARTLADGTLFAARAAISESDPARREKWTGAVRSNLNFVVRVQREDGNVGQAYWHEDGHVLDWDGEEGLMWIAALVEGYRLCGEQAYLDAARLAGDYYRRAVEDAYLSGAPEGSHGMVTSEDPQNAVISYVLLWEATGEELWLQTARKAAEYFMTFRWQYNTVFPDKTQLQAYDYRTKGLDISSPNNVHLHPFGLIATPELVRLWEATGDDYLLKQTRNHLLGCHQMLAPVDGAFDARRGMMTERWSQTQTGAGKGGTLPVSHAWCIGLVLYADVFLAEHGHVYVNGESGELTALEAVNARKDGDGWVVSNPWKRRLELTILVREADGELRIGRKKFAGEGGALRAPVSIEPGRSVKIAWKQA